MKRSIVATLLSASLVVAFVPETGAAPRPLDKRPFTVIAVVDSGIDPYHVDFRRPELTAHPSTYIKGFPKNTPALDLNLNANSWSAAYSSDGADWKAVKPNKLYWIPGTNVIGAIGPFDVDHPTGLEDNLPPGTKDHPFYDEYGHGTGVASIAGGSTYGPGAPDTLIVMVKGFEDALMWAAKQPWIDVVTNSWFNFEAGDYSLGAKASRLAVENGKVVCFASGNFSHPQFYTSTQGPSWIVSVGAASATTRGEHYYTDYPNDVLGLSNVPAALRETLDEEQTFGGTSAASPGVCGLVAKTISEIRGKAGDFDEGPTGGALVVGVSGRGALKDGKVTRLELEDAIQSTAGPASSSPDTSDQSVPALPVAGFIRGGYGIVDRDSQRDALGVILGTTPRPDRTLEDAWIAAVDAIRDAIWGSPP